VPHFTIGSNSLYLNGKLDILGGENDVSIGTNGFVNGQYSYRNSIAVTLGSANLSDPIIFPTKPTPANGGFYQSGSLWQQSLITGDTIHFNDQFASQTVLSTSWFGAQSYSTKDVVTSSDERNATLSPTVSLIYKPFPKLTTYATYAQSVEQGEEAPTGTANQNQFLAPYHDREYGIGDKYAISDKLLLTVDGFRMTRPLADTSAATNLFEVVGTPRNWGAEAFLEGDATPDLSVLGGVTYIDARLSGTNNITTNDKLVVGVPHFKTDITTDYHPDFLGGLAATAAVHSESARAATNTNNSFAPSYATLDIGTRYTLSVLSHQATLRFQVINVSDTQYFSSIADGNIVGSPGANTAYSGTPRTFEASFEVDF
jgi:iron complex outermembrane recepter protein